MNALSLLKADHGNVEALFKQFESEDDASRRRTILDHVVEQLSVHAAIEEQLFYPAVRAAAPDALDAVLEGLEEHHIVKWTLSELEEMDPADERFGAKVRVLIESVRHHVQEEENETFPLVRQGMKATQLDDLGAAMQQAKETAPTRPHPRQPDTPPLNVLLGAPMALLDRAVTTGRETVGRLLKRAG
jgi:hemerythrin superfamily protein